MTDQPNPEAAVRKQKRKIPPLTKDEYTVEVNAVIQELNSLAEHFTGANKKKFTLPDGCPAKAEYHNIEKQLQHTIALYGKLLKKPKKHNKKISPANRGFKQERWASPAIVSFVNTHGDLPADLKLVPSADSGGLAIWNIAQCTQLLQWYVEKNNLKGVKRSEVRLDANLHALFKDHLSILEKKQCWERDNATWIAHTALQVLIPKLFDRGIPILHSMLTEQVIAVIQKREELLKSRTGENRAKRTAANEAAKVAKKQAQAEAAQKVATGAK